MLRAAFAALLLLGSSAAFAADYPAQPIKVVVPSSAGGASDVTARLFLKNMEKDIPQPMVVVNMPGAGTALGSREVATSAPDGYTMLMMHEAMLSADAQGRFKEGHGKLIPVAATGSEIYTIAVHAESPYKKLADLIEAAKTGSVKAAVNIGGFNHFTSIIAGSAFGVEFKPVQYSGGADALKALLGKHVDVIFIAPVEVLPYYKSGDFRILAIMNDTPISEIPDAPTTVSLGYDEAVSTLNHMWWMPAGTDPVHVTYMADRLEAAMKSQEVLTAYEKRLTVAKFMRGAELRKHVDAAYIRIKGIVDELGLGKK